MDKPKPSPNSIYEEQARLAERELSAFIAAVTELYGPEQARLSGNDWLEELGSAESVSSFTNRHWREITIAASARSAERLSILPRHAAELVASN